MAVPLLSKFSSLFTTHNIILRIGFLEPFHILIVLTLLFELELEFEVGIKMLILSLGSASLRRKHTVKQSNKKVKHSDTAYYYPGLSIKGKP